MAITHRQYNGADDYARIDQFLLEQHQPGNADGNWIEPAWEYMHSHPLLDASSLGRIRIWEEDGRIVGVAHYEWRLGEAFFETHPAYRHLRGEMLAYAEQNLAGRSEDGRPYLQAYVNDNDPEFLALVQARGYRHDPQATRPMYRFDIPDPFPPIPLPDGFRLSSMAEDCDWWKIHRVLHRGFDHPGEPPAEDLEERIQMSRTPNYDFSLKIVTVAPNGDYASFSGTWYEPRMRFAYVEPVATDPDYRRLGLGKAAVLEGIRRCGEMGANVAYVGSDQAFYQAIGFRKVYDSQCWTLYLDQ